MDIHCLPHREYIKGVAIYVNEEHETKIIPEYSKEVENCMESLFKKIKLNDKICINVGCIYRAPSTDIPYLILLMN